MTEHKFIVFDSGAVSKNQIVLINNVEINEYAYENRTKYRITYSILLLNGKSQEHNIHIGEVQYSQLKTALKDDVDSKQMELIRFLLANRVV